MNKTNKCLLFILIGAILQTAIILVFVLTFLRIRTPKLRFSSVTLQNLAVNSSSSSPSFSMKLDAQVIVKNTNFGHYKFHSSTATVSYQGISVGEVTIAKGKAKARSTSKFHVNLDLSSRKVPAKLLNSGSDLRKGRLSLTSHATLTGKVHLFEVIKKKKSAEMSCSMDVNTKTKAIENLHCK